MKIFTAFALAGCVLAQHGEFINKNDRDINRDKVIIREYEDKMILRVV